METKYYLNILQEQIHSTIIATIDEEGLPVTRVIDIMLVDDNGLYFITAKGKKFYKQIIDKKYVSITGMTSGNGTMGKKSISIRGKVRSIGKTLLKEIFDKNQYMNEIYPSKESQMELEVFQLYEGQGEYFDLSTKPITRKNFTIGNIKVINYGYFITNECRGCKICYSKCPQKCIVVGNPCVIKQENCLHCGNCISVCPFRAIEER